MSQPTHRKRILFFIGSLRAGGKERRLVELLTYLNTHTNFELLVVLNKPDIQYQQFLDLQIPYLIIKKRWKTNDPSVMFQLSKISKAFKPAVMHTWGRMQTFYSLPAAFLQNIPLINSQITGAPARLRKLSLFYLIDQLNFTSATLNLSNSQAGLNIYKPPTHKSKLIYNGINLKRFENLPPVSEIKATYHIKTRYTVIMVASFTANKDYDLYYKIAEYITGQRKDISFIGVGGYDRDDRLFQKMCSLAAGNSRIIFPGKIASVEALVNACDVGVLFSPNGEGISNTILEYMALRKPVVATKTGGNTEIVANGKNGYLVGQNQNVEDIATLITDLIDDEDRLNAFGKVGRETVETHFNLDEMGKAFESVYRSVMLPK